MLDHALRELKEQTLVPVAQQLRPTIQPTALTLIGLLVGMCAALAAWQGVYLLALVLWLINRLLDGLDGTLARLTGSQSDLGGYLDILSDFAVYALIPIGLAAASGSQTVMLAALFLLATFYLNTASWMYLSSLLEKRAQGAQSRGEMTSITMPGGIIEGAETVAFYCLFLLLPAAVDLTFTLMGVLVLLTVGQRLLWALRHLDS